MPRHCRSVGAPQPIQVSILPYDDMSVPSLSWETVTFSIRRHENRHGSTKASTPTSEWVEAAQQGEMANLGVTVRKRHFLSTFYIQMIILPRQARDKHKENSKKVPHHKLLRIGVVQSGKLGCHGHRHTVAIDRDGRADLGDRQTKRLVCRSEESCKKTKTSPQNLGASHTSP